ncbi:MAG TPA: hypothetical protein VGL56_02660 [Fimbriimonadaceae bacterium]|jgi:hypothetical protein
MALRKLKELQEGANALPREEQIQLALYLLSKTRTLEAGAEALLSEASLAKDWLRPEEEQTWANL